MSASPRRPSLAWLAFAVALAGSGVLLLVWLSDVTFWRDEWGFLLHRRGSDPDVFLDPHLEHIAISLIALYKGLVETFGMDSPLPFQVVATLVFLTSVALMFVYASRRVGPWLALAGALPILVLGPAADDLLWPFQVGFFASMSAGLGALLALERRDRLGDQLACALVLVSISFSSLGLPFVVGVAVDVAWGRDRLRRAYVAAVPLALYGLWWLVWGSEADNHLSLHNLVTLPGYVLDGFASSTASLLGLSTDTAVVESPLAWGRGLLVIVVALAIWRLRRFRGAWRPLAVVTAIALAFWVLAGVNAPLFREPFSGRYQYMGAIFVVLIAAELLRGVHVGRAATGATLAVAGLAALSNVSDLHREWAEDFSGFGRLQRGGLAALELSRNVVDPSFELTEQNSGVYYVGYLDAGSYFSAVDAYGSPAYSPAELAAASEGSRISADQVFTAAYAIRLRAAPADPPEGCAEITLGREPAGVEIGLAGAVLRAQPGATAEVRIRRYAESLFPVEIGTIGGGDEALVEIPRDLSSQPWELGLSGRGAIAVCPLEDS